MHTLKLVPMGHEDWMVLYNGKIIVSSSRNPERDAAEWLLQAGKTGEAMTYHGKRPGMRLNLAKWRTTFQRGA